MYAYPPFLTNNTRIFFPSPISPAQHKGLHDGNQLYTEGDASSSPLALKGCDRSHSYEKQLLRRKSNTWSHMPNRNLKVKWLQIAAGKAMAAHYLQGMWIPYGKYQKGLKGFVFSKRKTKAKKRKPALPRLNLFPPEIKSNWLKTSILQSSWENSNICLDNRRWSSVPYWHQVHGIVG